MHITMSMWLLDDMTVLVDGDLSLHVLDGRNALLHGDGDLILRHAEVVVVLQEGDCSTLHARSPKAPLVVVLRCHDHERQTTLRVGRLFLH